MEGVYWISDEAWAKLEPLLPKNRPGPKREDNRRVISGILHVLRSGCRWSDCPPAYGPRTTISTASTAGASRVSGESCSSSSQPVVGSPRSSPSTPPTSRSIAPRGGPKKGGRDPSGRSIEGRPHEQDTRAGRRSRPAGRLHPDARQHRRHQRRQGSAGNPRATQATARRQGL